MAEDGLEFTAYRSGKDTLISYTGGDILLPGIKRETLTRAISSICDLGRRHRGDPSPA